VTGTLPYAINNRGQIAGTYADASGTHGFILEHGHLTTLDVPSSGPLTVAMGINDVGQVVGTYGTQESSFLAEPSWGSE
jgi:uncharacterized membrane protein